MEFADETFAVSPGSESICREVSTWILQTVPWSNGNDGLGLHPLDGVARSVQEDIAVMSDDPACGYPIVAGVVCFPSGWSIREKLGMSIGGTHESVPGFAAKLQQRTERMFSGMKPLRSVARRNWMISPTAELALLPSRAAEFQRLRETLEPDTLGRQCRFRVEYQTLTRMPESGAIVFTILTLQCPLDDLNADQIERLAGVVRTCPDAVVSYKRLTAMRPVLLDYFDRRIDSAGW